MELSTVIACLYILFHSFMHAVCNDNPDATIVPKPNFDYFKDADDLHGAMDRWGTAEETLINILGQRTSSQRKEIATDYKRKYGKSLLEDLKHETSGDFEELLLQLTYSMDEFLARQIESSFKKKDDLAYLEIICTCDEEQLKRIKAAYFEVFKISLSQEIEKRVLYVPLRLLLLFIIGGFELPPRSTEGLNDRNVVLQRECIPQTKEDCRLEAEKGGKLFTMLARESFTQISTVVKEYGAKHKHTPVEVRIKDNCEDESLKKAYITIVNYAENPAKYYATVLKNAMQGLGTKERVLDRIILWRSEIDLAKIAQSFHELTQESLVDRVKSDTSGDYQKLLLKIIKGNRQQ